jgi:hypothetical protein
MCRGSSRHPFDLSDSRFVSGSEKSPLEQLAATTGRGFPNLLRARKRTATGLEDRRARLGRLHHDPDTSVVLMGSWGRAEVTEGSDDDFMVLINGPDDEVEPSIDEVRTVLDRAPGDQGVFGEPVPCDGLVENVGLDRDDNTNLTRRMLSCLSLCQVLRTTSTSPGVSECFADTSTSRSRTSARRAFC